MLLSAKAGAHRTCLAAERHCARREVASWSTASGGRSATGSRHQAPILLGTVAVGLALGAAWPAAGAFERVVDPAIAVMLLVTSLAVPFRALADGRPAPAAARGAARRLVRRRAARRVRLSRFVDHDAGLVAGALLVRERPA